MRPVVTLFLTCQQMVRRSNVSVFTVNSGTNEVVGIWLALRHLARMAVRWEYPTRYIQPIISLLIFYGKRHRDGKIRATRSREWFAPARRRALSLPVHYSFQPQLPTIYRVCWFDRASTYDHSRRFNKLEKRTQSSRSYGKSGVRERKLRCR